ncbi:NADH-dependent flavin oxidoreductase [Actinobacillus vicugnae]|uniref:NADH-dependent flavin oxidoreductase n=1 Tax=Actinobacillus vicugnae TaxID=2573093 RepID=UPI001240AC83|nr:NADH-dependent flavin oxidoreductase [Actinobacillus vicugnae]
MNPKFSPLFQSYTLNNGVEIKNRLVVAPMTHFGSNTDGTLGEPERKFISNRANDMGMFITAATLVQDGGKAFHGQPEAIHEWQLGSLKATAEIIKAQGAKAILQIHHGGKQAVTELLNGKDKISASADEATGTREATDVEVRSLIAAFGNAADLAIRAGFDGVEIHGANNYVIQQFYSGHSNRRTDEWGGSRENRMRFPLAVVDAVLAVKAKHAKADFIVGYRFSPEEPEALGLTMEDTFALVDALVEKPLQYLHISLWDFYKKARRGADSNAYRLQLVHDRIAGKLPLIGVGNLYTPTEILEAFNTDWAEFIALGKTVMVNPDIATRIINGNEAMIQRAVDPEQTDHYGFPDFLWNATLSGTQAWLPPLKGQAPNLLDL